MTGLKAVEIGDTPAGELVGRTLVEHGAHVTKVEPPHGARSRHMAPFAKRGDPPESLHFRYYNRGKDSRLLDLRSPDALVSFEELLSSADVVISSLAPAELDALGLDLAALSKRHPALIVVSTTPFGLTGPWRNYLANDLVSIAAGGSLIMSGYDDHSIPPICPSGGQSFHTAASFALSGLLIALIERLSSGTGQLVDIAIHDSLAVTIESAFGHWEYSKQRVLRQTCRHAQPRITQSSMFECGDGRRVYFNFILAEQRGWDSLVAWLDGAGMAADLTTEPFRDPKYRQEHFPHIHGVIECFFLVKTADEILKEGQKWQMAIGIINAPEDLFQSEHLRAREFFKPVHEYDGTILEYPGPPYRYTAFDLVEPRRAPMLGERLSADDALHTPAAAENLTAKLD